MFYSTRPSGKEDFPFVFLLLAVNSCVVCYAFPYIISGLSLFSMAYDLELTFLGTKESNYCN
jgi:hypothetical protein